MRKIITIIIILLIIIGIYFATKKQSPDQMAVINVASYSCDSNKTIAASYTANSATLVLSDERTLVLPQTISASGTRYEKDGIVFVTKGSNAFLQEEGTTTYDNCLTGKETENTETTGVKGMKVFADVGNTFTFSYPETLSVTGGDIAYTQAWRNNTQTRGLVLASITIPKENMPQTNFGDAKFTVGTSSDPAAIKDCLVSDAGTTTKTTVTSGGVQYTKFISSDAGAGNFYETTSYRTLRNKQCYAIEYTIHSVNIGNYPIDAGITEFNKAEIVTLFENIITNFSWVSEADVASMTPADALLGKWTGVEGTLLTVEKADKDYTLKFVLLDGPMTVKGTAAPTGITFTRANSTYTLHKGTGKDTGMKYLVDKKNCVVVAQYEGYCKD